MKIQWMAAAVVLSLAATSNGRLAAREPAAIAEQNAVIGDVADVEDDRGLEGEAGIPDGEARPDAEPSVPSGNERVQTMSPRRVRAEAIAPILRQLFPDTRIVAVETNNRLIVFATSEVLEEIWALVRKLEEPPVQQPVPDVAAPSATEPPVPSGNEFVEVLQLRRVRADAIAPILKQVFPNTRIAPEDTTNSLIVAAAREVLAEIKAMVRKLEEPPIQREQVPEAASSKPPRPTQRLRELVSEAFETRQAMQRAEVERFRERLARIEQTIAAREARREEIIDRRVEELLDSEWLDPPAGAADAARGTAPLSLPSPTATRPCMP